MRKLLIVDLQDVTRIGLHCIASGCNVFSSIYDGTCKEDVAFFLKKNPDGIVTIDYTLMDISEEYLMLLHARYPKSNIILFCDALVTDFVKRIIYSYVNISIILKDCSKKEIERGLADVAMMRQFICEKIANQIEEKSEIQPSPLTATEREILKLMAFGKSTKDIASLRFLSVNTVMTHRKNIFRKLSVNNVHEATRYAVRAGLVDLMEYYI